LELKKRQDLFATMASSIWKGWSMKDLIWLEIPIERKKPLIWEFLLVAKS